MAQRQRRDWRDSFSIMRHFGKVRLRGAAEPLSAGAGVRRKESQVKDFWIILIFQTVLVRLMQAGSSLMRLLNLDLMKILLIPYL